MKYHIYGTIEKTNVALVVPVFNNWFELRRCLPCLAETGVERYKIIVVDNGSEDDIASKAFELSPNLSNRVLAVRVEQNIGFAGGANVGAALAIHCNSDYIYFLNDDCRPRNGFLTQALEKTSGSESILVSSVIVDTDTGLIQEAGKQFTEDRGGFDPQGAGHAIDEIELSDDNVDTVSAAGFLITTALFEQCGGFDEELHLYFEDTELSLRAQKAGARVCIAEDSIVDHRGSSTIGELSATKTYYLCRNYGLVTRRYTGGVAYARSRVTLVRRVLWFIRECIREYNLNGAWVALKGGYEGLFAQFSERKDWLRSRVDDIQKLIERQE